MRVLGYIRVSTDQQADDGHSLELQPRKIYQWCELRGLQLVGTVVDEAVSGGKPLASRPGGRELLQRLRAGDADGIVVVRLDRLFRDALDGLRFFAEVAEPLGVAVHSVSELIDTSTPAGRLQISIQLAAAQYEREMTAERNRSTTDGLRRAGRVYGGVPFGCVEIAGRLYKQPADWRVREFIVDTCRPVHGRSRSLAAMARDLQRLAIPAPAGGTAWSKSTVKRILDTHAGLIHLPAAPDDGAVSTRVAAITAEARAS